MFSSYLPDDITMADNIQTRPSTSYAPHIILT